MRRTRAALAAEPTLAVAGAAYDGVGIPLCIGSGETAAEQVVAALAAETAHSRSADDIGENRAMADEKKTETATNPNAQRLRELNATIRYTMWSVFRPTSPLPADRAALASEVEELFEQLAAKDVMVRGIYDVAGLRADADVLIWWHSGRPTTCRTRTAGSGAPRWAGPRAGLVADGAAPAGRVQQEPRPGVPGRRGGAGLRLRLPVRPLLRVVPAARRRAPGDARRARQDGARLSRRRANTVASFALGDYEWMLAFEADELHRIVDLMRDLRGSTARRHVREEVPFYTGRRRRSPS